MKARVCNLPTTLFIAICALLQVVSCGGGGGGSAGTGGGEISNAGITTSQNTDTVPAIPIIQAANSAPSLSVPAVDNITVGVTYRVQPVAVDSDGDPLLFSIENCPPWLSFDISTGLLFGAASANDVGSADNIVISVSDGIASVSSATFSIYVAAAPAINSAPILSGTPATIVSAGNAYDFQAVAADNNHDPLVFSISNRPGWANFDSATGRLWGTPMSGDVGISSEIVISVSDGVTSTMMAPFSIRVAPAAAINSAPILSGTPAINVTAGNVYRFQAVATDANADSLIFSIENLPHWAHFDRRTGVLSGTPTASDVGASANIKITVSDGSASASLPPFSISVSALPPAERKYHPGHYVQMYKSDGATEMLAAIKPGVVGMVRYYCWREFETSEGIYDFSKIQADLDFLTGQGMRLIVQVGDKTFNGTFPMPPYLQGAAYMQPNQNGGYTAVRWDPYVIARYKALIAALGKQFDRHENFEGITTAESALGFDEATLNANDYTPQLYRDALINVLVNAAQSFPRSRIFWFMNFFAGNQGYIADVAAAVASYDVALGGPDVLPDDPALKKLTYPFYPQFQDKMRLFGSMMTDSYRELHADATRPTKYWTMDELFRFARDSLHVNYIFWTKVSGASAADSYEWKDAIPVIGANPSFN